LRRKAFKRYCNTEVHRGIDAYNWMPHQDKNRRTPARGPSTRKSIRKGKIGKTETERNLNEKNTHRGTWTSSKGGTSKRELQKKKANCTAIYPGGLKKGNIRGCKTSTTPVVAVRVHRRGKYASKTDVLTIKIRLAKGGI